MIKADNSLNGIGRWLLSDDAKNLIFLEACAASDLISDVFGYHVVQLGGYYPTKIMALSRIQHKILASLPGSTCSSSDLSSQNNPPKILT